MAEIAVNCAGLLINCFVWFFNLLESLGFTFLWITALLVNLAFKFVFGPIFGIAKSDLAHQSYNAFKRRKEK